MPRPHVENRRDFQTPEMSEFLRYRTAVEDDSMIRVLSEIKAKGLPEIQIGPLEGRILEFLVRASGGRKVVEVGTLAGYSALWIARGLAKDGHLWTCEAEPKHADVAETCLDRAGLKGRVSVVRGDARKTLIDLEIRGPFDLCFIDADKTGYPDYIRWAGRNLRPGGIVALDNAFLFGGLPKTGETPGQAYFDVLTDEKVFVAGTMIPTGEGIAVGIRV